ncbi:glucose-1-phosphate thymidylyltransferase RfbA [Methylophilaceae bacterium]|nr:glucose-1-phosphate thymidylyltransferase RfbA [Methylophilaceae bacterium]
MKRKGIILAGGSGSRLYPVTQSISKQLLPVFDKPMIYYPLTTLMLGDIREILIISTPQDLPKFKKLFGDGSQWGLSLSYKIQPTPDGIAQSFILGEDFIGDDLITLILGDNIFYGNDLEKVLYSANKNYTGATIFAYQVKDPERYGVVQFNKNNDVISIDEKPLNPKSNFAITGLYYYDQAVVEIAKDLKPSKRNELEITDINNKYIEKNNLSVEILRRGFAWLDTGTHQSLLNASQFISTIESRQGLKIACPEEIAYLKNWITSSDLKVLAQPLLKNEYGEYLLKLIEI